MNLYDFSFSVVVIAENNNPTILNPDFLIRNDIVPADWKVDQGKPIFSTPALSRFEYELGVSFQMDPERLIVRDSIPDGDIFPVPEIMINYMKAVPHVKYHSLGLNYEKVLIFDDVEKTKLFQRAHFLKDGPWNREGNLSEFVSKFVYSLSDSQCNVTFSSYTDIRPASLGEDYKSGLILSGNFHRDYKMMDDHNERNDKIVSHISNWEIDKNTFQKITETLIGD